MTPQELSSEKDRFSTSFIGLEEDFYTDLTLETYLEALSHSEPVVSVLDSREETSAKRRGRALHNAVKKLTVIEFKGKEYVEEYVRWSASLRLQPQHHQEQPTGHGGFHRVSARPRQKGLRGN